MNYGELKAQIRDLGFAEDAEIDEFDEVVPNAINRAITEINLIVAPNVGTYKFEQDGTESDLLYYDMEELTADEDGTVRFLEFTDTPVMVGPAVYKQYNDFEIENDKVIIMNGSVDGSFKVFYKRAHTPFTLDSEDSAPIELPLKVHHLVPLLASYYIWMEDENAKAVSYYNQYERLVQEIKAGAEKPRARIMSGGI